jgi:hypothetical protein
MAEIDRCWPVNHYGITIGETERAVSTGNFFEKSIERSGRPDHAEDWRTFFLVIGGN